jgi:cytochrome bd-type quinol oxidase subunit 2
MKSTRWPIWKIAVAAASCAGAAVLLFVLSVFLEGVGDQPEPDAVGQQQLMSLPAFVMILGVVAVMLCVLSTIWLGARIRESRIPPWERGRKKRKR